jgi:hypothetical protein
MSEPRIIFSHDDPGYCRVYYKSVISGNAFCFQEETKDSWLFYICSADDWEEPITTVTPPPYVLKDFHNRKNV